MIEHSIPNDILEAWADDLESGQFVQGRGCLQREVGDQVANCCLGVLCHTLKRLGWDLEFGPTHDDIDPIMCATFEGGSWPHHKSTGDLPTALSERLGMPRPLQQQLINFNDFQFTSPPHGRDFPGIATFIREELIR